MGMRNGYEEVRETNEDGDELDEDNDEECSNNKIVARTKQMARASSRQARDYMGKKTRFVAMAMI